VCAGYREKGGDMEGRSIFAAIFLFSLLGFLGCDTLNDYKPKTTDEELIKATLVNYFEAWNKNNADGVLSLVHEDAQMMVGSGRAILSKKQFSERLSERFKYAPKFTEGSPKMKVDNDEATVIIPMRGTEFNLQYVVKLVRANDRWYIMSKAY